MGRAQNAAFHEPVMKPRQKAAMMGAAGDGDSFGDGLAGAARSIIADARRALTDPELTDAEAVHEVRKALKRWRALLRLFAEKPKAFRRRIAALWSARQPKKR